MKTRGREHKNGTLFFIFLFVRLGRCTRRLGPCSKRALPGRKWSCLRRKNCYTVKTVLHHIASSMHHNINFSSVSFLKEKVKGTIIISCLYKGGAIIAADSCSTVFPYTPKENFGKLYPKSYIYLFFHEQKRDIFYSNGFGF